MKLARVASLLFPYLETHHVAGHGDNRCRESPAKVLWFSSAGAMRLPVCKFYITVTSITAKVIQRSPACTGELPEGAKTSRVSSIKTVVSACRVFRVFEHKHTHAETFCVA